MIVFDAGALVALDRNDRFLWTLLREAVRAEIPVLVPLGALAQVWRGGSRQARLAQALDDLESVSFDELARAGGELCGRAGTGDVVDASVALVAARTEVDVLCTSDPGDLKLLIRAAGRRRGPRLVVC